MKFMIKKTLAFLLTLVMLVNIFPVSVFADPETEVVNPLNIPATRGTNTFHTVIISVAQNVTWEGHLYFVLKQEGVSWYQDEWNHAENLIQYCVGEIPVNGGTVRVSRFKVAYNGATDNPYDNSVATTAIAAVNTYDMNQKIDSSTPITSASNVSEITNINSVPIIISTDNVTDTTTITIGDVEPDYHTVTINGLPETDSYAVRAKVEDEYYYGAIEYTGNYIAFSDSNENMTYENDLTNAGKLPGEPSEVIIVQVLNNHYGTQEITDIEIGTNHYFISERNTENKNIELKATQLQDNCSVTITDTVGLAYSDDYTIIAINRSSGIAYNYAPLAEGVTDPSFNTNLGSIHNNTSFRIVKGENISQSDIRRYDQSLSDISESQTIDNIVFKWTKMPNSDGIYQITVSEKPTNNVSVTITQEGNEAISGNFYIVYGSNDTFSPNTLLALDSFAGTHTFTIDNLDQFEANQKTLFIVLKRYTNGENASTSNDSHEIVWNGDTNKRETIDNEQYDFTWSGPVKNNGIWEYTITAQKYVPPQHTVTMTVAEGVPTDNLHIVFYQHQTKNGTSSDYYSWQTYQNGTTTYTLSQLHVQGNTSVTTPYDPTQPLAIYLIRGKDGNYDIQNIYLWNEGYRFVNGSVYADNYEVTIDPSPAPAETFATTISIGLPAPKTYKVALRFYEQDGTTLKENVSIGTGYTIEASDGTNSYHAALAGSNEDITFYDASEMAITAGLPQITSWVFKKNGEATDELDDYEIVSETPETENTESNAVKRYVFKAKTPKQYTVELTFKDSTGAVQNNVTLNETYTLVAITAKAGEITSSVTGTAALTWSNSAAYLPRVTEFMFKDVNFQQVTKVDDYLITYPSDMDPADGIYHISLHEPQACTVSVNNTTTLPKGYDYYIIAYNNGMATGYAKISSEMTFFAFSGNTGFHNFRQYIASVVPVDGTAGINIDEETTFNVVRVAEGTIPTEDNLTTATETAADTPSATGNGTIGQEKFRWSLENTEGEAPNFAFTISKNLPEDTIRQVNVNLYQEDGTTLVPKETVSSELSGKFYVIILYMYEKDNKGSAGTLVGYKYTPWISASELQEYQYNYIGDFDPLSYAYGSYNSSGDSLSYDEDLHVLKVRLYETTSTNSTNHVQTYMLSQMAQTVEGYRFKAEPEGNVTIGDVTTLNLKKSYPAAYKMVVQLGEGVKTNGLGLLPHAQVSHTSGNSDIYDHTNDLVEEGEQDKEIIIFDATNGTNKWNNNNGTGTFSGNETTRAWLTRNGTELSNGSYIVNDDDVYLVTYPEKTTEDDTADPDKPKTVYTDYIKIEKIELGANYSLEDIVGPGINFGITANVFNHTGHLESNFATNYYTGDGSNGTAITPDYAFDIEGNMATGAVVAAHIDGYMAMNIPGGSTCLVYTDPDDADKVLGNTDFRVIPTAARTITNSIVNPIINHGSAMSATLAANGPTIQPTPGTDPAKLEIDLTIFPDNTTIYLDGDALAPYLNKLVSDDGEMHINRNAGQIVVFNFKDTEEITLKNIHWKVNGSTPSDEDIARHAVFNFVKAEQVDLWGAKGVFLVPNDNATTKIYNSSEGWLITGGTFEQNDPGCEWHMKTHTMIKTTSVNLVFGKQVDGGNPSNNEVFEFELKKWDENEEGRYDDSHWENVKTLTNVGPSITHTVNYGDGRLYKVKEKENATGNDGQYIYDPNDYYAVVRYIYDLSNNPIAAFVEYFYTFEDAYEAYQLDGSSASGENTVSRIYFSNTTINNDHEHDQVTIRKKDQNGKLLAEAEFGIFETNQITENPIKTFEAGTYIISTADQDLKDYLPEPGLGPVTLYVIEISSPSSKYTKDENPHALLISASYTDEQNTNIKYTMSIDNNKEVVVVNTYGDNTSIMLTGTKTLTGRDMAANEFHFTVTETVNDVETTVATGSNSAGTDGNAANITFTPISYTQDQIGIHTYTITEDTPLPENVTQTGTNQSFTVVVEVDTDDNNDLIATIIEDMSDTIVFTNNYNKQEGSLTVTKTWAGDDQSKLTEEQKNGVTFTVTGPAQTTGGNAFNETFTYAQMSNDSKTFEHLTPGEYTVTETNASYDGFTVTTKYEVGETETSSVMLADGDSKTITVTNTVTTQKGALTINKTWQGDTANLDSTYKNAIKFRVTGPYSYSREILYSEFTSDSYTIENLPVGDYTVSELNTTLENYEVTTTYHVGDTETGTVTLGTSGATVAVTNNYNKQEGDLSVEKKLEGEGADPDRAFEITVTLNDTAINGTYGDMTFTDGVAKLSLKGREKKTATGLPAKTGYKVEETADVLYELASHSNLEGTIDENGLKEAVLVNKYVKPDKPTFEKKIQDTNDTTGETSGWQDSADYDIGDSVPYKLSAILAKDVTNYWQYHVTFHDTMEKGLTFGAIQSVKVNGTELPEGGYAFKKTSDQAFDLTVTFNDGKSQITDTALNGGTVEVLFTAVLNENAVLGKHGNVNTASLEYSCNPSLEDDGQGGKKPSEETEKTPDDSVIAFTYKAVINKTDKDGKALGGAEFRLEKKLAGGGTQVIACVTAQEGTEFTFTGLDDGDYILTETKAPEGYKAIDPITFTVTAEHNILWTDAAQRDSVLAGLSGNAATGSLTMAADAELAALTGSIRNEKNEIHVTVKKTDVATGEELAGAKIQVLDEEGNVVDEWTSDDSEEGHEITGLETGKTYTLREAVAPEGYTVTTDTTFTVDEDGKVTSTGTSTTDENGNVVLLVEDAATSIKVAKTDIADGEELSGAHIQILDKDGNIVEEWDSVAGTPHEVTKLLTDTEYTLRETVAPKGYLVTVDTTFRIDKDGKVTATCTIRDDGVLLVEDSRETTSAAVRKVWEDDNDKDGKRPVTLTVYLLADGEIAETVTLSAAGGWTETLQDLPKTDKEGKDIEYTWTEELPEGYTLSGTATDAMLTTLTNTHEAEKIPVSVQKVWDDKENADGTRPESISVQLYADGTAFGEAVTLDDGNGWSYTWADMDKYINETGSTGGSREIVYSVDELNAPEGYIVTITGDGTTGFQITNTLENQEGRGKLIIEKTFEFIGKEQEEPAQEEELMSIPVTKIWDDNNNQDGVRPASITVHLYEGGTMIASATLSEATGWAVTFTGLQKYRDKKTIRYYITEDPVDKYTTEISGYTITNRHKPQETSATIHKRWINDDPATRPASVRMRLSDGTIVTLSEATGWTATITGLPAYEGGKPIAYTWSEETVAGYKITSVERYDKVTTVINEPFTIPKVEGQAMPKLPGDEWVSIDDYETALGINVLINHVGDCFD